MIIISRKINQGNARVLCELATNNIGIKKQNINMWVKRKQNIPKKYLPILKEIFGLDQAYFSKYLTEIEKLEIQKEKLKKSIAARTSIKRQVIHRAGLKLLKKLFK